MADIIDISTKEHQLNLPLEDSPLDELEDIISMYETIPIKGFLLCIKEPNGDIVFYRNDAITLRDRSFMLQLLQSDIFDELSPTGDLDDDEEEDI